jgi:hypothetical protein
LAENGAVDQILAAAFFLNDFTTLFAENGPLPGAVLVVRADTQVVVNCHEKLIKLPG